MGESYEDFEYTIKIFSVSYDINGSKVVLNDDLELVYSVDPLSLGMGSALGLSSIEYNEDIESLMLLTSFEEDAEVKTDEHIGAYLWQLPLEHLETGDAPVLVKKVDDEPLMFAHKGEGVAVISKNKVVVIHDDDEIFGDEEISDPEREFLREPNEAAYTIVELSYGK